VNAHLDFLLSAVYDGADLHPEHLADLHKSGLSDATIARQRIRSVPPDMLKPLLGFDPVGVRSAYLIPFADLRGGWLDYLKLKVFGDAGEVRVLRGGHVEERHERWRYNRGARKYLVRRATSARLFLPLATMDRAVRGSGPLYVVEGEKKALAVSQLGLPAVGLESAWGWHGRGSRELLPDFDLIALQGRTVELVPDSDVLTNPMIEQSMRCLADALRRRGARARIVLLPEQVPA
jgi:hypothetical protein